jgi:quercetin dioxygenase-like cupin family protein
VGTGATGVIHTRWAALSPEFVTPHVQRRYINTGRLTVGHLHLARGGVVPRHSHENEQVSCVLSGALKFILADGDLVIREGETLRIAPWVEHQVEVLEDAVVIDIFAPVRADWVAGTDDYFRRAPQPAK